jgi:predicted signal transduction protein with EAL and GGDEF domain
VEKLKKDNTQKFALFFIDIDFFKQVNDLLGHDVGDLLLVEISERLKSCFKGHTFELDIPIVAEKGEEHSSSVFRLGGDEFTTLVKTESVTDIAELANKTINEIKKPYLITNKEIIVSCSIGISIYPDDADNQADLVKYADIAMYQSKESKDCHVLFDKIRDNAFLSKLALEEELKKALLNEQLVLNYQALLDAQGDIIGLEALIRWDHPRLGILLPNDFIPIAEKYHHMVEIGEYILRTSCKDLKKLHNSGFDNLFVFVNCTNKQFYDLGFIDVIDSVLKNSGLEPRFLKLGLEEEFSIKEPEKSLSIIKILKEKGIQFGIDGFGKGKSILSFLSRVPEDSFIKIDRSYVSNLEDHPNNIDFLHSILDLIKARHLNPIVSGIETEEQNSIISPKKCIVQGYYFNKPKAFDEFVEDISNLKSSSN